MRDATCPKCAARRAAQLRILEVVRAAKAYKQKNNLDVILICKVPSTKDYDFCEEGDPRLGNEYIEIERLIL